MNVERLHAIALELKEDFEETALPTHLSQLTSSLNALAQNPADANASQQVASERQQLDVLLAESRTNTFSDAWVLALQELGVWDLLGDRLRERIEEILSRHEITPATAASEITEIDTKLQGFSTSIDSLVAAFEALGIRAEELDPGEFEVGFLIPREAVDNALEELGGEFEKLDETLRPFMELAGETRTALEVRSISSSEFYVVLAALPGLALTIAKVVESLLSSYEKIRNIRDKAASLEADGVPVEAIVAHANERMEIDIDALTNELVGQATARLPEGRGFELQVDVKRSLQRLAKRIDEGYSIEVRAFVPPDEDDEETPEGVTEGAIKAAREITERQPRMRRMNLTGQPILELPEGDEAPPKAEPPGSGPSDS